MKPSGIKSSWLIRKTAKIGSLADVNESSDAEGLRVFYYLVQDLKVCLSHQHCHDCDA